MTAAQNTLSLAGPNRFAGYLAVAAAGLLVAVVGLAISARPITESASLAYPPHPVIVVPTTIKPSEPASAYIDMLNAKGAAVKRAAELAALDLSQVKGINLHDAAIVVPAVSGSDQANAYMQFLLQRHADAFGRRGGPHHG